MTNKANSEKNKHKEEENHEDDKDTFERCKPITLMNLQVKPLLGGQTYEIEVSEKCTIGELKGILEIQYKIDTRHVILVHHDKQLEDNRTAVSCGLQNNSTLYMMPTMRSGPLKYKVNTRAVNRFMSEINEDLKEAIKKVEEDPDYPVQDDDVFMVSVDDKGEMRVIRISNVEKKSEANEDLSKQEIKVETHDTLGENHVTRTRMFELQRKMKESRERQIQLKESRRQRKSQTKKVIQPKNDDDK